MIYLRSKRPRTSILATCCFKVWGRTHVMMALTQENVHYTLNSGPGIMNKSNRVHVRIQEFLSGGGGGGGGRGGGGGGVEAQRPENSLDNVFFSHQLILQFTESIQWFYTEGRRGSNFFQGVGGGVEAQRPENSLDNVFFSHQLILQFTESIQWFYTEGRRGSNFFQGVGVSKETDIICDFLGGVRTP